MKANQPQIPIWLSLFAGILLTAAPFLCFHPNHIAPGGITGVARCCTRSFACRSA